jgi:hypothetical protein
MSKDIKNVSDKWALAVTDKLQNTLTIACKFKLMRDALNEFDKDAGTFFYRHIPRCRMQEIVDQHKQILRAEKLMPTRFDTIKLTTVEIPIESIAKANATAKMLKPALKWRWLASGSCVTLLPLYQWLTWALKGRFSM